MWTTAPADGYPYPTYHFGSLKEVRATWRAVGARRLWELNTAVELWNDPHLSAEGQRQLLRWSREDFSPLPSPVLARLGEPPGPLPRDWTARLEGAAKQHGCAAYSWLRAAVLEAAPIATGASEVFSTIQRDLDIRDVERASEGRCRACHGSFAFND